MKTISGLLTVRAGGCFVRHSCFFLRGLSAPQATASKGSRCPQASGAFSFGGEVRRKSGSHLILDPLSQRGQRQQRCPQNAPKRQPGHAGSLGGAKEISANVSGRSPAVMLSTVLAASVSVSRFSFWPTLLLTSKGGQGVLPTHLFRAEPRMPRGSLLLLPSRMMNLSYILARRTNGANPFKIFEALPYVDAAELKRRICRMEYSEFLETAYWFAISHTAKARAGTRCQVCNSGTAISAHHRTYDNHGAEHLHMNDITVLCENCHGLFHGHMEAPPVRQPKRAQAVQPVVIPSNLPNPGKIIPHTEEMIGMPDGDRFTLTLDLINACRANGAFTSATTTALGLLSPLISGWAHRLVGRTISRARYRDALEGRFIYGRTLRRRQPGEGECDESAFLPSPSKANAA